MNVQIALEDSLPKESSKPTRTRASELSPSNVKSMGAKKHLQTQLAFASTSIRPTSVETNLN